MKQVTVTFTGEQARLLISLIRNDTEQMKRNRGFDRNFVAQNDRIEEKIIKAILKAEGKI